jgi:hypothetical protein
MQTDKQINIQINVQHNDLAFLTSTEIAFLNGYWTSYVQTRSFKKNPLWIWWLAKRNIWSNVILFNFQPRLSFKTKNVDLYVSCFSSQIIYCNSLQISSK